MPIDLYHIHESVPCRVVRLAAAAIGVELNLKLLNVFKKEQFQPEYLEVNPQHAVPILGDGGFYLSESRAIATYLIDRYAEDHPLYPSDPKKRAVINNRLYFDALALYQPFFDYYIAPHTSKVEQDPGRLTKLNEALAILEIFLDGKNYVAGDEMTVADIAIATTVSSFPVVGFDLGTYENTSNWLERMKTEIPQYEEINEEGLKAYEEMNNVWLEAAKL